MDDIPFCPPWWPDFIWSLLHRRGPRGGGGVPVPVPWIVETTESLLLALNAYHVAATLGEKVRGEVRRDAVERMQEAVARLAEASA
jgi:hypothetical protein